ncbi:MAG: putative pterin-4-alpha-carbinolamine dehydratase [Fimbriimonadales bacterium]|nr:MAG: putative pterin-4-alpha-carbinolamine dehydratase [Fimbriimonadales bacterium]
MMAKLTDAELEAALKDLDGWTLEGIAISKVFEFDSYARAALFTQVCAFLAEKYDHHPDLLLTYGKVKVTLYTHSEGGVTLKDTSLAREINLLAETPN